MLAKSFKLLEWANGRVFMMKVPEAREVFDMLESLKTNPHVGLLTQLMTQPPEVLAQCQGLQEFLVQMGPSVIPLHSLLESFPKSRVGKIPKSAVV